MSADLRLAPLAEDVWPGESPLLSPTSLFPSLTDQLPSLPTALWATPLPLYLSSKSAELPPVQDVSRTLAPLALSRPFGTFEQSQSHPPSQLQILAENTPKSARLATERPPSKQARSKTVAPLAEVLNDTPSNPKVNSQPQSQIQAQQQTHRNSPNPRKRRRLHSPSSSNKTTSAETRPILELPRPNITLNLNTTDHYPFHQHQHQSQQHPSHHHTEWLPPLLQGLHEPPPDAGIFPPITINDTSSGSIEQPFPTPLRSAFADIFDTRPASPEAAFTTAIEDKRAAPTEPSSSQAAATPSKPSPSLNQNQTSSQTTSPPTAPALSTRRRSRSKSRPTSTRKSPTPTPTSSSQPPPPPTSKPASSHHTQQKKKRTPRTPHHTRLKWSTSETSSLLLGISRFGIGAWKRILHCSDYTFSPARTAVDLKDRFRTLQQGEEGDGRSDRARSKLETATETKTKDKRRHRTRTPSLALPHPLPRAQRRARRPFTAAEDARLQRGFAKHGRRWAALAADAEVGLGNEGRSAKDLRDRVRVAWPWLLEGGGKDGEGGGEGCVDPLVTVRRGVGTS